MQKVRQFYGVFSSILENNIPLSNITAVATDCAPAKAGRYRGFASLLKEKVPDVHTVYCAQHKQHLVHTEESWVSRGHNLQKLDLHNSDVECLADVK